VLVDRRSHSIKLIIRRSPFIPEWFPALFPKGSAPGRSDRRLIDGGWIGFRMVGPDDPHIGCQAFGAMVKMTVNIAAGYSAPVTGWPAMAPLLGSDGLARVQRCTVGRVAGRGDGRGTVAG
jgi:hypothetical protein